MKQTEQDTTLGGMPIPSQFSVYKKGLDGIIWIGQGLAVIESTHMEDDGRNWLHVSVSRADQRIPSYELVQEVRRLFIGEDKECYMVFPPEERYVNLYPALHLFCCLDHPKGILPHFEGMRTVFGKKQRSI